MRIFKYLDIWERQVQEDKYQSVKQECYLSGETYDFSLPSFSLSVFSNFVYHEHEPLG